MAFLKLYTERQHAHYLRNLTLRETPPSRALGTEMMASEEIWLPVDLWVADKDSLVIGSLLRALSPP